MLAFAIIVHDHERPRQATELRGGHYRGLSVRGRRVGTVCESSGCGMRPGNDSVTQEDSLLRDCETFITACACTGLRVQVTKNPFRPTVSVTHPGRVLHNENVGVPRASPLHRMRSQGARVAAACLPRATALPPVPSCASSARPSNDLAAHADARVAQRVVAAQTTCLASAALA